MNKFIAGVIALFGISGTVVLGGIAYEGLKKQFGNGIYVGDERELSIDENGNVSTSGTATVGTFTQGGGCYATSTSANGTLQAADIDVENCVTVTPTVGDITITLAASTTAMCPSTTGQVRSFLIRNATTTATADVTIAAGTGIALKRASSTPGAIIQGDTDGKNFARIDVTKLSTTDCVALMTLFND